MLALASSEICYGSTRPGTCRRAFNFLPARTFVDTPPGRDLASVTERAMGRPLAAGCALLRSDRPGEGSMMKPANHLSFASALLAGVAFLLPSAALAGPVTAEDLRNADANRAEWIFYGRDYGNQRFSPLDQITPENVTKLRPVWAFSTGGQLGGLESTPLF